MSTSTHGAHQKCREGDNCVGPGCKRHTGKTRKQREKKEGSK